MTYTLEQIHRYLELVVDDPSKVPDNIMAVFTRTDVNVATYLPEVVDFRLTHRGKQLLTYIPEPQFELWMNLLRLCNEETTTKS